MLRSAKRPTLIATVSAALMALGSASAQRAPAPAGRATTRPAAEVLAQIGQSAGVVVLVDATVQARLPVPAVTATPDTVEQQIAEMVRLLPGGTKVEKLYVPAPANGRWIAGDVADYARAQARLVGAGGGRPAPAGQVEILGRQLPVEKAREYIEGLNLKLVYLVSNPQTATAASAKAANWARMNPDQRRIYAQQQAQRLLALDPASRVQAMRQMMLQRHDTSPEEMIMRTVIEQMPEDERMQFMREMHRDAALPE
jgi:hypothetical protein